MHTKAPNCVKAEMVFLFSLRGFLLRRKAAAAAAGVWIRAAVGYKNAAIEWTVSAWTKVTRHETGSSHGAQSPQVGASGLVPLRGGEAVQSDGFFGVWRNTSTCLKHFAQ